jgi:hypothetical protein
MVFLPQILLTNINCWFGSILRETVMEEKSLKKEKEAREKIIEVASRYNFTN